jgi:alkylation response protein AidB-like acyl-CoA dehydrogenase
MDPYILVVANIGLTEDQIMLRETALKFATEKMEPFAKDWDEKQIFPVEVLREAAQLGFGGKSLVFRTRVKRRCRSLHS